MSERAPLASIALVSCAALASEVLLTRFFAIVHWHHFAYMMISLALLGFGASGTFLFLARRPLLRHFAGAYSANLLLFGGCTLLGPAIARQLPFRAEELLWNPWQPLWLVATYLALSLAFFCAANAIGLALMAYRRHASRLYAADLTGAGAGSLLILAALAYLEPEQALKLLAAAGFAAALLAAFELRWWRAPWIAATAVGLLVTVLVPRTWLCPEPGPYKALSQALQISGTRVLHESSGLLGRVTVIESPQVPLRYAPGLSLTSASEPPPQLGLFTDGDQMDAITAATDDPERLAFLAETTSALPYAIARPRAVLVLGAGGGLEILRARHLGATLIDAVELNPQIVGQLSGDYRDYTGGLANAPGVSLYVNDARGYLATPDRRYELIQMSLVATAAGGLGGLSEDYAHTREALALYYERLAPQGILSMTRFVQVPPRDGLKLLATTISALQASGVTQPGRRLLAIRGWQTVTVLVKKGEVTADEIERTRALVERYGFDFAWYPGMPRALANRNNLLPSPWFYDGIRALLGPNAQRFIATYPFDIRPTTDDRPYFQNFFRWRAFMEAWQSRGRGGMALLEAGYVVLAATVLQAILAGLVLIVVPLALLRRQATHAGHARVLLYFTGIGLAFLFVEIVFLQKMQLVVHHPTVALALVLGIFLIGAGIGSLWTARVSSAEARRTLIVAVSGIVLLGALYSALFDPLLAVLSAWPLAARALVAALLLMPLAFLMGTPFPLALRELTDSTVPWAWGINGCASVVSPALASLLAIDVGLTTVLFLALLIYSATLSVFPPRAVANY
jgi:spermidine synthase